MAKLTSLSGSAASRAFAVGSPGDVRERERVQRQVREARAGEHLRPGRAVAHARRLVRPGSGVSPQSGICESSRDESAVDPTGVEPTGRSSRPVEPTGVEPTGVEPTGVEPTGVEPTGVEPTGVEPTGVEPTGVDPTGVDPTGDRGGGSRVEREPRIRDRPRSCTWSMPAPALDRFTFTVRFENTGTAPTTAQPENWEVSFVDSSVAVTVTPWPFTSPPNPAFH